LTEHGRKETERFRIAEEREKYKGGVLQFQDLARAEANHGSEGWRLLYRGGGRPKKEKR